MIAAVCIEDAGRSLWRASGHAPFGPAELRVTPPTPGGRPAASVHPPPPPAASLHLWCHHPGKPVLSGKGSPSAFLQRLLLKLPHCHTCFRKQGVANIYETFCCLRFILDKVYQYLQALRLNHKTKTSQPSPLPCNIL